MFCIITSSFNPTVLDLPFAFEGRVLIYMSSFDSFKQILWFFMVVSDRWWAADHLQVRKVFLAAFRRGGFGDEEADDLGSESNDLLMGVLTQTPAILCLPFSQKWYLLLSSLAFWAVKWGYLLLWLYPDQSTHHLFQPFSQNQQQGVYLKFC